MALRRGGLDPPLLAEDVRAGPTALRPVLVGLVDPLERKQPTVPALVARLPAGPPPRDRFPRARRGGGRVGRGRQRGVARAPPEALLEVGDALLQPPIVGIELVEAPLELPEAKQDLNARLPPRVVDRLRLGTLHASRDSPPPRRSLPHDPRRSANAPRRPTQRLHFSVSVQALLDQASR